MNQQQDDFHIYPGEFVTVGTMKPTAVNVLETSPLAHREGVFVLAGDNVRHVYSTAGLYDEIDTLLLDHHWVEYCYFFTLAAGVLSPLQLTYVEDRLAHMFKIEDFETGSRVQRLHKLPPEEKEQADRVLLLALAVSEETMNLGLFAKPDGVPPVDLKALTLPLTSESHGPLIP